jgi:hypothetical protein
MAVGKNKRISKGKGKNTKGKRVYAFASPRLVYSLFL